MAEDRGFWSGDRLKAPSCGYFRGLFAKVSADPLLLRPIHQVLNLLLEFWAGIFHVYQTFEDDPGMRFFVGAHLREEILLDFGAVVIVVSNADQAVINL
jgi:hypothetical protein